MRGLDCVTANKITPTESTEVFTVKMASDYNLSVTSRDVESQSSTGLWAGNRQVCWTLGVDLPIFLIVLGLIGLFELGVIPCHKSGFYCNDPGLSFPYDGDTVSTAVLMCVVFLWPLIVVFLTELVFFDPESEESRSKLVQTLRNTGWVYRVYLYGFMMNLSVVEVMKGIVGGPRPTFFYICEPDTAKTCNGTEFVSNFECTSTRFTAWEQLDSYRSFPSGHTSMSVFCALFVAWYLQRRAFSWRHRTILVVPAAQLLSVSFAVVASLTRVTDRRHHWWDVLAGSGVAFLSLFYAVIFLCDNFSYLTEKSEDKPSNSRKPTRALLFDEQGIIT